MSHAIPRLFVLRRDRDVTGVSGAGDVADGVQWPDGSVVLRWRERPSTAMWDSLDLMLSVHGHDGATRVVWAADQARAAAGRAYLLADRWQAANGLGAGLVRAAGTELLDILEDDETSSPPSVADLELPPPEGPEYTSCACGHIEPEHSAALFRHCLKCGCHRYRIKTPQHGSVGANDTQACPYCTGAPQFLRSELAAHIENRHARVLAALAGGISLDEVLHDAAAACRLPHEVEG